jgi:tetratricopeptide (TPR) repeat protein
LTAAIELEPNSASTYVYRGSNWLYKKEFERAIDDYSTAIRLAPEDSTGFRCRAMARSGQGKLDEAIADLDEAVRLSPKDAVLYLERGDAHHIKKRFKEAWEDYSTATRLAPELPQGYSARAEVVLESDNPSFHTVKESLQDAQRACELTNWQSAYEIGLLAWAHAEMNEFDNAIRWTKEALAICEPDERRKHLVDLAFYKAEKLKSKSEGKQAASKRVE